MESKQSNWELIAKALLIFLAMVIVAGMTGYYVYSHYGEKHPDHIPTPGPFVPPSPWPTPVPDYEVWYSPPASVLRCLPNRLCDGVNRAGQIWRWEMNRRGEYRWRNAGLAGSTDILEEIPKDVFDSIQSTIGQELEPIPDP